MPISITCAACKQRLKANESLAGRVLKCPKCKAAIAVPRVPLDEDAVADLLLSTDEPPPTPRREAVSPPLRTVRDEEPRPEAPRPKSKPPASDAITMKEPPPWLRHLHWVLIAALIPLAFSLLWEHDPLETTLPRLLRTIDDAPIEVRQRAGRILDDLEHGKGSIDRLFEALPDQRVQGAHLARGSQGHWIYAIVSAIAFLGFIMLLASYEADQSFRHLFIGLFTATVGILFLFIVQAIATWSQYVRIGGGGLLAIVLLIAKFIGFSYQAALDPENGFLLSFVGYTAGVGFCEEICKALPLVFLLREHGDRGWRTFFLWGLASGAGFGIAEGVIYSANAYNGLEPGGIYLVRFVSCVALHALWTGSVGITLEQNQHLLADLESWYDIIPPMIRIVAVPMILHGLYDTFLKKDMPGYALLTALASFLFLAFQISRLHGADDERERKAMLREYKKRRRAGA